MRVGSGPANFIMDLHDPSIATSEIRRRFKAGEYGNIAPDHARGWFQQAGRT